MSHEVDIYLNELPQVTGAGHYHVDSLWKHIDRNVPIHVLIFVLEGTLYVSEEGKSYEVPKHHMIILKANSQQSGLKYINPGSNWLWVNFLPIELGHKHSEIVTLPKVMSFGSPHTVEIRLRNLLEINDRNEPYKQQLLNGALYRIQMYLLNQAQMRRLQGAKRLISPKVINLLKAQVSEGLDTQVIAKDLDLNYSYISRKFKEETGETVKRFYLTLRVNEAIKLFQTTNLNVAEISNALNFPNPYHFGRVFKMIKGVSPGAYRKQLY